MLFYYLNFSLKIIKIKIKKDLIGMNLAQIEHLVLEVRLDQLDWMFINSDWIWVNCKPNPNPPELHLPIAIPVKLNFMAF